MSRKDLEERLKRVEEEHQEPQGIGLRRLSMILFALIIITTLGCSTAVSIVFNDPKWFEYGGSMVFTSLILVAIFGWPIND